MWFCIHRLLLWLNPEVAHHLGSILLKLYQKIIISFIKPKVNAGAWVQSQTQTTLKFPNPVGLAAGFDKNAELFVALSQFGFGFIEVGTVTPLAQDGNPKPRLWRVEPEGLINQMGFNNCGVNTFKKNLQRLRSFCSVPVLANIGKNKSTSNESAIHDYATLFSQLSEVVDGFVVNISSPNTVGLRELQSIHFLEAIERVAPRRPVWVKLAPDLSTEELVELFKKIKKSATLSGCVLTNTSREIAQTEYAHAQGGYSGEKLFERSLECVSLCREVFGDKKSIIAVGGINSLVRARKMLKEGANLVEIYTGFVYRGPSLIKEVSKGLADQGFQLSF